MDVRRDLHRANGLGGSSGKFQLQQYSAQFHRENGNSAMVQSSTKEAAMKIADTVLRGGIDDDLATMWMMGLFDLFQISRFNMILPSYCGCGYIGVFVCASVYNPCIRSISVRQSASLGH